MKPYNLNTMKNTTLTLIIFFSVAGVFFTGCNSPEQKVEEAQTAVVEANQELEQATQEYRSDMKQYREKASDRIAANDSMITSLKANMANETADMQVEYEEQLAALEQKNSDMKNKLADYKAEGKEQWETFKTAFNREMDTLGEAFTKLTDKMS